nr:MAG TPA: hypothetical protein [Crassvirales sp.]
MKEKLINDAIQYVIDNHLEDKLNSIVMKIIKDTHSIDILNITMFVCVSIYITDKYTNNEK